MNKATEYRHYAEECERLSQQTQDAPSKNAYLALARYWRQLSDKSDAQPNQHLVEPLRYLVEPLRSHLRTSR
jgi:hypothetical protein